jgi:hypothetical protein
MQLHVKCYSLKNQVFSVDVTPQNTISDIKSQLHVLADIPPSQQHLIYAGHELTDSKTLEQSHIDQMTTCLFLVIREDQ